MCQNTVFLRILDVIKNRKILHVHHDLSAILHYQHVTCNLSMLYRTINFVNVPLKNHFHINFLATGRKYELAVQVTNVLRNKHLKQTNTHETKKQQLGVVQPSKWCSKMKKLFRFNKNKTCLHCMFQGIKEACVKVLTSL